MIVVRENHGVYQRTLTHGGKDDCTVGLQFNKTFVCSEAADSKLVKLETSRTALSAQRK